MTWTQNGINWVLQKFGDENLCCVADGLTFHVVDITDVTHSSETGGTPLIVGLLTSGTITSVTMENPNRGTFTPTQMNNANGSTLSFLDATELQSHDAPGDAGGSVLPSGQWCYTTPTGACCDSANVCSITTKNACVGTYCGDGTTCTTGRCPCTPTLPNCSEITTQAECNLPCFWYKDYIWDQSEGASCHDLMETLTDNWFLVAGAGAVFLILLLKG